MSGKVLTQAEGIAVASAEKNCAMSGIRSQPLGQRRVKIYPLFIVFSFLITLKLNFHTLLCKEKQFVINAKVSKIRFFMHYSRRVIINTKLNTELNVRNHFLSHYG